MGDYLIYIHVVRSREIKRSKDHVFMINRRITRKKTKTERFTRPYQ